MAFARGKFGIEYNPAPRREDPGPIVPIVIVLVFVAALVSLGWTIYGRLKGDGASSEQVAAAAEEDRREAVLEEQSRIRKAESSVAFPVVSDIPAKPAVPAVSPTPSSPVPVAAERPAQVRNLLRRLDEAVARKDVEMAVTTIEKLRTLPEQKDPALDDSLARKLGSLNIQRLLTMRSPQWTVEVTVGRGDSASQIAAEHGSTLRSMERLNPHPVDLNHLRIGQKLRVMDHPKFSLRAKTGAKSADLFLNGRFFKRYDLSAPVSGKAGTYLVPARSSGFWPSIGLILDGRDRNELNMLLPAKSTAMLTDP